MAARARSKPGSPEPTLAACACFNARNAARAITDLYDRTLAPSGLRTNQFAILATVQQSPGGSMQAIASRLGLDPSTMTRVLRPLEDTGLIRVDPGDSRREKRLSLTDRGRKKLRSTTSLWQDAQNQLRKALGNDVFERLLGDLGALNQALRA